MPKYAPTSAAITPETAPTAVVTSAAVLYSSTANTKTATIANRPAITTIAPHAQSRGAAAPPSGAGGAGAIDEACSWTGASAAPLVVDAPPPALLDPLPVPCL